MEKPKKLDNFFPKAQMICGLKSNTRNIKILVKNFLKLPPKSDVESDFGGTSFVSSNWMIFRVRVKSNLGSQID